MSDPRLTPDPTQIQQRIARQISVPLCDLCRTPDGPRDRQLLFGAAVTQLGTQNGWSYVQAELDGYVGYVRSDALQTPGVPTHSVSAPVTRAYRDPDFKSPDQLALSHLSHITALSESAEYIEMSHGFIPRRHLAALPLAATDPAAIAQHYLGTDYLWGGNSRWGIDCSGLIQAALTACGLPCPGDSNMQRTLGADAAPPYRRNDLLFWNGHVALVTDPDTLIHANAGSMDTRFEPIADATVRIAAIGDGPITAHRRLFPLSGLCCPNC